MEQQTGLGEVESVGTEEVAVSVLDIINFILKLAYDLFFNWWTILG